MSWKQRLLPRHLRFLDRGLWVVGLCTVLPGSAPLVCDLLVRAGMSDHPALKSVASWVWLMPLSMVAMAVGYAMTFRFYRRRIVDSRGRACVRCGYPLLNRVTRVRCSECGLALSRQDFAICVRFARGFAFGERRARC